MLLRGKVSFKMKPPVLLVVDDDIKRINGLVPSNMLWEQILRLCDSCFIQRPVFIRSITGLAVQLLYECSWTPPVSYRIW